MNATADHVDQLLEALKSRGIPRKGEKAVAITELTRVASTNPVLHAEGHLDDGTSFAVSIGPRYGPITVQQVDEALHDAYGYDLVVFAGFTATAEAQSMLAPGKAGRFNVLLLEANADLLLGDLLRNTSASQTFRLFAAPDVSAEPFGDEGDVFVELRGVDVYDAAAGEASSRGRADIAAWFLDHDYDGEVFHVCQAFFPQTQGWDALARSLRGTLDEEAMAKLASFQSNPFKPGKHDRAAVRVVDFAGQTSEAVVRNATSSRPVGTLVSSTAEEVVPSPAPTFVMCRATPAPRPAASSTCRRARSATGSAAIDSRPRRACTGRRP